MLSGGGPEQVGAGESNNDNNLRDGDLQRRMSTCAPFGGD